MHFTSLVFAVVGDFPVGIEILIPSQSTLILSFFVFNFPILTFTLVSNLILSGKFLFFKLDFNGETSVPSGNGEELESTVLTVVIFLVA